MSEYDPTPEASPDYAEDGRPPTERQLAALEQARQRREAEAVLIALHVADGEQPPAHAIEKFRQANAAFHIAQDECRGGNSGPIDFPGASA